ncbi:hypothetical protein J4Q44_G00282220 [Coregonus suidteri]|uniref:Uncharacterized protein n=1 Tax=Coregonus suidteri TaxID=861788 RepID=A0AAN8KVY1_9TELE
MDMRTRRGPAARCRVPEERFAALQDVARMGANNAAREAIHVRETFTTYFFKEGAVRVLFSEQAQVYNCGSFHLQRIGKRTNHVEYCVGEPLPLLNCLTQRAQHDQRYS